MARMEYLEYARMDVQYHCQVAPLLKSKLEGSKSASGDTHLSSLFLQRIPLQSPVYTITYCYIGTQVERPHYSIHYVLHLNNSRGNFPVCSHIVLVFIMCMCISIFALGRFVTGQRTAKL